MPLLSSSRLFVCFFVFSRARESSQEREREREREFYFFIFFRTRGFRLDDVGAFVAFVLASFLHHLSRQRCDVLKRGQKKRDVLVVVCLFFGLRSRRPFFSKKNTKHKGKLQSFFESVLSNTTTTTNLKGK